MISVSSLILSLYPNYWSFSLSHLPYTQTIPVSFLLPSLYPNNYSLLFLSSKLFKFFSSLTSLIPNKPFQFPLSYQPFHSSYSILLSVTSLGRLVKTLGLTVTRVSGAGNNDDIVYSCLDLNISSLPSSTVIPPILITQYSPSSSCLSIFSMTSSLFIPVSIPIVFLLAVMLMLHFSFEWHDRQEMRIEHIRWRAYVCLFRNGW